MDIEGKTLRQIILMSVFRSLKAHGWNRTETAKSLCITTRTVRNYIHEMKGLGWEVLRMEGKEYWETVVLPKQKGPFYNGHQRMDGRGRVV